jgi:Arc/MetJ-type ribon-helix-helix transcriptional regulator
MAKKAISITLPIEYYKWLEKKVQSHDYGSISHGITLLIRNEINREGAHKNE